MHLSRTRAQTDEGVTLLSTLCCSIRKDWSASHSNGQQTNFTSLTRCANEAGVFAQVSFDTFIAAMSELGGLALLAPNQSGAGASHWQSHHPHTQLASQSRARRRSSNSGARALRNSLGLRCGEASSAALRSQAASRVGSMFLEVEDFEERGSSRATQHQPRAVSGGPALMQASTFSTANDLRLSGGAGDGSAQGSGGRGSNYGGERGSEDQGDRQGSASNGGSGGDSGAGADGGASSRKTNPLVDLIETETAYVAELSKIIRVSSRAQVTSDSRAHCAPFTESRCGVESVEFPAARA